MQYVADLHLHSKYSRAVSQDMILPTMAAWAKKKGIDILTTGDWTHPLWFREIKNQLEEAGEGVYKIKDQISKIKDTSQKLEVRNEKLEREPLFLLTVEVSSIYSQGGRLRRMHNLIFAPSFLVAEKINKELARRGVNLMSDGRPIMGLPAKDLLELVLTIDKRILLIPCHAWTPWFSLYGSNSGFDSIEECFGDYSKYIYAIETGLSSDPVMNWKIQDLDNRSILSFSDAHSPAKMGREATVFELEEASYENIRKAIIEKWDTLDTFELDNLKSRSLDQGIKNSKNQAQKHPISNIKNIYPRIAYTIEFYPEEGKYHYTGHRNCKVVQSPQETAEKGTKCPVCGRTLTVGVEHRVEQLAQQQSTINNQQSTDRFGVTWIEDEAKKRPSYVSLVPLLEIIAEALELTTIANKAKELYVQMVKDLGPEFEILLKTSISAIEKRAGPRVAEGVKKVRERNIVVSPGYDGEFGVVKIWPSDAKAMEGKGDTPLQKENSQLGLF